LAGTVIWPGGVVKNDSAARGGFDVGKVVLDDGSELVFWNEYMTLERSGARLATFPDLIVTMDAATGLPVSTAEVRVGQRLAVVVVRKNALKLGAGVKDKNLYHAIEQATGKPVIEFACAER